MNLDDEKLIIIVDIFEWFTLTLNCQLLFDRPSDGHVRIWNKYLSSALDSPSVIYKFF